MHGDAVVNDRPERSRYEIDVEGRVAYASYARDGNTIVFEHTFVPGDLRGHGLGTRLVEAALADARRRHFRVVPQCPLFADYMDAHPETHDLLAPPGR